MCGSAVSSNIPAEHGSGAGPPAVADPVRPVVAKLPRRKQFWRQGEPLVWATGGALSTVLLLTALLIAVVLVNGLGVFWPSALVEARLADGTRVVGRWMREETNPDNNVTRVQFKTGNRELGDRQDFRWYVKSDIVSVDYPPGVFVLERLENGDFFGFLEDVQTPTLELTGEGDLRQRFDAALAEVRRKRTAEIQPIIDRLYAHNRVLRQLQNAILKAEYRRKRTAVGPAESAALEERLRRLRAEEDRVKHESDQLVAHKLKRDAALRQNVAMFRVASGQVHAIPLVDIVRPYTPNAMSLSAKIGHYLGKIHELLWDEPRESNTEGGLFPSIFGTVMLVFLMSIVCFPLGVLAGIYLGEYAREGVLVRLVRIAVNNLAGIPSIVYGIFGLGFFVYGLGGLVDNWLFPERTEATYGTGGLLWASLTLGLLTVPVVIVSTEEALRTIPRSFREGSYALGATKLQTLWRVLVPMASPGMMTGFILAMARAAGEVAPLMITGVVKLAPTLPVDGTFPFFHPDRKFMHLGYHIFDIAYQSPNVEASMPMVFVTTLLLVLIVLAMSSAAILLRNRMRTRFQVRGI